MPPKRAEVLNLTQDKSSGSLLCWDKTSQGEDCPGPSLQTRSSLACPVSTRKGPRVQPVLFPFSLSFPICTVGVLVSDLIEWLAVSRRESKSVHSAFCSLHFNSPFRERCTNSSLQATWGSRRAWSFSDVAMLVNAPQEQDALRSFLRPCSPR